MKLYFSPGACSLSPHIALCEAGLTFEAEQVDLKGKKTKSGADFFAINPKGQVPALALDGGGVLTEGTAIVQYVADHSPGSELAPKNGTIERYRLQEWLSFISTELHKGFSPLFRATTPDAYKTIGRENLAKAFKQVEGRLARREFLLGDHFTVADGYLYVMLRWADRVEIDMTGFANLAEFKKRMEARPKIQQALKAEGLA
ncbi:MAG TPA: glutathione transferase GstA [Beijerinckiaceae bacterium]|nr:glutathione transferase GstA [Beijerinckiaceae bacterium]